MRGLSGAAAFLAVLNASEARALCFEYCRADRTPPCEKICPDTKIIKEAGTFSIIMKGLGSDAVSGIPDFLNLQGQTVQNSASSLTIKDLSKEDLDRALTTLKADKSTINIPQ